LEKSGKILKKILHYYLCSFEIRDAIIIDDDESDDDEQYESPSLSRQRLQLESADECACDTTTMMECTEN